MKNTELRLKDKLPFSVYEARHAIYLSIGNPFRKIFSPIEYRLNENSAFFVYVAILVIYLNTS